MDKSIARTQFRSPRNQAGIDARCTVIDYGQLPGAIAVADVTEEQHALLIAMSDVTDLVPHSMIDAALTAEDAQRVTLALEQMSVPAQWVTAGQSWREVLRTVAGVFLFAQRMNGKYRAPVVPEGYTLDSTWADLPVETQQQLLDIVSELRVDYMGAGPETTLRSTHAWLAGAWEGEPIMLGGVVL